MTAWSEELLLTLEEAEDSERPVRCIADAYRVCDILFHGL